GAADFAQLSDQLLEVRSFVVRGYDDRNIRFLGSRSERKRPRLRNGERRVRIESVSDIERESNGSVARESSLPVFALTTKSTRTRSHDLEDRVHGESRGRRNLRGIDLTLCERENAFSLSR